jgi:ABC-type nitrate/sulfonate/bicarbonate transport system substrate-binding protein
MGPSQITRRSFVSGAGLVIAGRASAQPLQVLPVGLSSASFGTASVRIAKELGIFDRYGLSPRFIVMESGAAAAAALISGSINVVLSGTGELIPAQARGQNVVLIATTYGGFATTVVLARSVAEKVGVAREALAAARFKALDGQIIAVPSAASSTAVTFRNLSKALGVNIRLTYMAQPAMTAALESGAIHGFGSSAPFWAVPVVKGTGVVWLSGPKGEFPAEHTTLISGCMLVMRPFAEANRELMRTLAAVVSDLGRAVDERPNDVRAAAAKLYPELDTATLDLILDSETHAWKARSATVEDIAHEIVFVSRSAGAFPGLDRLVPASLLFP